MLLSPRWRNFYELSNKLILVATVHTLLIVIAGYLIQTYFANDEKMRYLDISFKNFTNHQAIIQSEIFINSVIKESNDSELPSVKNYLKVLEASGIFAKLDVENCDKKNILTIDLPSSPYKKCFALNFTNNFKEKTNKLLIPLICIAFITSLPIYFFLVLFARREARLKLKNELFEEVRHNINSPLITLYNLVEKNTISSTTDFSEQIKSKLETIQNYLKSPGIENQDYYGQSIAIELNKLIPKIIEDKKIEAMGRKKIIQIRFDKYSESCLISAPIICIESIISNLINNSINAIETSGEITVSAKVNGKKVCILVIDNGRGIEDRHKRQLFKKGFTFKTQGGTGSGLYQANYKIKELGGSLDISSQLGVGTTVEIKLPALDTPNITPGKSLKSIFILEDDALLRSVYEFKIKESKLTDYCNIKFFSKPLELYNDLNIDNISESIFILDAKIDENEIAGIEVAKQLHKSGCRNIYIHSAYSNDNFNNHKFLKGFIKKDYNTAIINKIYELVTCE